MSGRYQWFHITCRTYGSWLPGDMRGFATRRGRTMIAAAQDHDWRYRTACRMMKRLPVRFDCASRRMALECLRETFEYHGAFVSAVAVGQSHAHMLASIVARDAMREIRRITGIAKKRSARRLSDARRIPAGGAWAAGCHVRHVSTRQHLHRVSAYIRDHASQSHEVWQDAESRA